MGKITKRLVWLLLAFLVGLAGNLIAAWIQNDVLQNLFTPRRLGVTGLLVFLVLILMAWKELRDENSRPDDKQDLTREQRNRLAMLAKVRSFWVTGVLEQSLHGAALIELGKEYKPDAVHYPWTSILQRPDQPDKSLPSETKTIEVFDGVGGELLILGAPGSGKTTMLLDLARDLIVRAKQDDKLPIPVVFNLSSWAEKRPPLADWMAEELNFRYDVPKKIAAAWVKNDAVLPLLDGLDEVKLEHRAACAGAINCFRQEHWLRPMVLCSRIKEYYALNAQLRLQGAIRLQPLSPKQIDRYLKDAGEQVASVRVMLERDASLRKLAKSPLMLSIMMLAYSGLPIAELAVPGTLNQRRKHLFDTYVKRMFKRPNRSELQWQKHTLGSTLRRWLQPNRQQNQELLYTPEKTIYWLSWLARRVVEHEQTTFYLERMQPSWLQNQYRLQQYSMAVRLGIGLVYGMVVGLAGGLVFGLVFGPVDGLVGGLGGGLVAGLFTVLVCEPKEIRTVETLRRSSSQGEALFELVGCLAFGLAGGVASAVIIGKAGGLAAGLIGGPIGCLAFGPVGWLIFGLATRMKVGEEVETKVAPNQGIWLSAQNALLGGLLFGLLFGLLWGLGIMMFGELFAGLFLSLFYGFIGGLVGASIYGGFACIQHATLRLFLYRDCAIPLNYVRFLDYCAERIFLRKVGGGYIFVHRLLMEYFAGVGD